MTPRSRRPAALRATGSVRSGRAFRQDILVLSKRIGLPADPLRAFSSSPHRRSRGPKIKSHIQSHIKSRRLGLRPSPHAGATCSLPPSLACDAKLVPWDGGGLGRGGLLWEDWGRPSHELALPVSSATKGGAFWASRGHRFTSLRTRFSTRLKSRAAGCVAGMCC